MNPRRSAVFLWLLLAGCGGGGGLEEGLAPLADTDTWVATSVTSATPSERGDVAAVWTGTEMIVYGGRLAAVFGAPLLSNTGARYNPVTDAWTAMASGPLSSTDGEAVWTGTEMIVWNGSSGARYNPASDSWTAVSEVDKPPVAFFSTLVWTGTEMITWGGQSGATSQPVSTGGRFNPAGGGTWRMTSTINAPNARIGHTAVWTGQEMIIWGGFNVFQLGDGAIYNPSSDTWRPVSNTGAPSARSGHIAVWTGAEMILYGSGGSGEPTNQNGARYNPVTNTWTGMANGPFINRLHSAVWTGTELVTCGAASPDLRAPRADGYNPATNTWRSISAQNNPCNRVEHAAVWTGAEMIIWGGIIHQSVSHRDYDALQTGARYRR